MGFATRIVCSGARYRHEINGESLPILIQTIRMWNLISGLVDEQAKEFGK